MKRLFCGILAGLLLCLTGCGAQPEPEQLSLFAMDTYMSLAAYGDGASEALAACDRALALRDDPEVAALAERLREAVPRALEERSAA